MGTDYFTYIVVISIAGVFNILLGFYAYQSKDQFSGSKTYTWISFFSAIYAFGHACELAGKTLADIWPWIAFQYTGLPFIAPVTLILMLQYCGHDRHVTGKNVVFLLLIPILSLLFVLTNPHLHFFYQSIELQRAGVFYIADFTIAPWYIIHGSYTSGCLIASSWILISYWKRAGSAYWKQLLTLLISVLLPMLSSLLYLLGAVPFGIDPVPVVMCFTSGLTLWAILANRLLIVTPIARDKVFESMRDGVIILDLRGVIIDFNLAAWRMIPGLEKNAIGENAEEVLSSSLKNFRVNQTGTAPVTYQLERNSRHSYYQVQSAPIFKGNGKPSGRTIIISDITEETLLKEKLEELAYKDGMTGIFNRTYFIGTFAKLIKEAAKEGSPLSLMIMDIDHFKSINDTFGHLTGDEAIGHVVQLAKEILEGSSLFARYGGEEFVAALPGRELDEAASIAEDIRMSIAASPLRTNAGKIAITASFGAAALTGEKSIEDLLSEADHALYEAKRSGRNRVCVSENGKMLSHIK
ncbi:diguanylate cyclase [Metabacillus sp. GX 13764]|uniref:histidine kinase N-terminal 7TM domain-containing diguanylate cyclase n=1 Tax=Metabacillus kandeliae TaxID=2900151 RepID=UPI001E2CE964|nr:histidine kinase N-terminal 7TM domain-containing protein [Metabacillus kandeliae]MCD7035651.1 diguanylate cyclase [Metabacillus kandeliae]